MKMNGYSTHQPLLIAALLSTDGPILEMGGGFYSTPLISSFANQLGRKATTVETSKEFSKVLKQFETPLHEIRCMEGIPFDPIGKFAPEPGVAKSDYIDLQQEELERLDGYYSVIFVDHGPGFLRAPAVKFFADKAEFVIMHDTNHEERYKIGFMNEFKYRWDFTLHAPHTTVVSNTRDCSIFQYLNPDNIVVTTQ